MVLILAAEILYSLVLLHQVAATEEIQELTASPAELGAAEIQEMQLQAQEILVLILLLKDLMAQPQGTVAEAARPEQKQIQIQVETVHNLTLLDQQLIMLAAVAAEMAVGIHHQGHQADPAAVAKQEITTQQHTAQMV